MDINNNTLCRVRHAMSIYSDCGYSQIPENCRFIEDLNHFQGYSKLSLPEFLMVLEEEFDIELDEKSNKKITELNTVYEFAEFITENFLAPKN
ncbi:hypothetical protein [Vibrio crassostreae]|uniref:hypothetical protein n=1 Tax=Vibrio crassostreae TaxID=246167 RepID=UPI001B30DC44|nr:hypothetical protein [Vibrio crassostreae]